jgi:hypothetical protein
MERTNTPTDTSHTGQAEGQSLSPGGNANQGTTQATNQATNRGANQQNQQNQQAASLSGAQGQINQQQSGTKRGQNVT